MDCPLCKNNLTSKIDEEFYSCPKCSALVKDSQQYLSAAEEKARYETHNNDVNDVRYQNFTAPITNYVLDNFTPAHQGLDFGSGTGPVISKMLQDKRYQIAQFDIFFANNPSLLIANHYDYIACCEVIEHFKEPYKELKTLSGLLKKDGELLIMTLLYNNALDFTDWFYIKDPTHIFIYQKETIEYIAREFNLQIKELNERFIVLKKQ